MATIRLVPYLIPRFAAVLACLLLSAPAWSQFGTQFGGRNQWQILEARYGTARSNIDVTPQLRQLAAQNSTFQVTNRLFGNDPDPGVVKTLRIYARGPGGTRVFEYQENDIVDGSAFTGWSSGNWGQGGWGGGWGSPPPGDRGQWQILHARYGTARGTSTSRNSYATSRGGTPASRLRTGCSVTIPTQVPSRRCASTRVDREVPSARSNMARISSSTV